MALLGAASGNQNNEIDTRKNGLQTLFNGDGNVGSADQSNEADTSAGATAENESEQQNETTQDLDPAASGDQTNAIDGSAGSVTQANEADLSAEDSSENDNEQVSEQEQVSDGDEHCTPLPFHPCP